MNLLWEHNTSPNGSSSSSSEDQQPPLVHLHYGYDQACNRTFRKDLVATSYDKAFDELYIYDGLHRLKTFHRGQLTDDNRTMETPTLQQGWVLDATGNWKNFSQYNLEQPTQTLDQQRLHNRVNEITDVARTVGKNWATPEYDRNGNMTEIPQPNDPTQTYKATYDAWNRLTKLEMQSESGLQTVQEVVYDGHNWRIGQKDYEAGELANDWQFYYTSSWQCLEEHFGPPSGGPMSEHNYVWGLRHIDDLVLRQNDSTGSRQYVLKDTLYSTVGIVSTSGHIEERIAYSPYGESHAFSASYFMQSISALMWAYQFTGRRCDFITGLYDYRSRLYHPKLGRFIQTDVIGYAAGLNLYEYVDSNPVRLIDPFGFQGEKNEPQSNTVDKTCEDLCGPDVTGWYFKDLRDHYQRVENAQKTLGAFEYKDYWYRNAAYLMSYKWMSFTAEGCGTGRCKHTVMLAGVCVRKNQLGNIAFGFIVRMIPPYPVLADTKVLDHPIYKGYLAGPVYDPAHPHAANYGAFAGMARADNLAAFSLGYYLGAAPGFDPLFFKTSPEKAEVWLNLMMSANGTYDKYSGMFGGVPGTSLGLSHFTFVPEYGGFDTRSCNRCMGMDGRPAVYSSQNSSAQEFEAIEATYKKNPGGLSLNDWLKKTLEDYTR